MTFDVLTHAEFVRKIYIPILDKPPEEQDWDIDLGHYTDWWGHTGLSFLVWYTEESDFRWNEYDPVYEEMWKDMASTVDLESQEEKIRQMMQYVHENVYRLSVYCPLSLYAVNKEVNFVPQKNGHLRLKETSVTDNHWSVRGEKK